jgi:uncharacterized protein
MPGFNPFSLNTVLLSFQREHRGGAMVKTRAHGVRAVVAVGITVATLFVTTTSSAQQTPPHRSKVVIQVSDNDPAKWGLVLNNAKNLQTDLGAANVDIEIVAYGPGLAMLKLESPVAGRIDEATVTGIKIEACENTMRNQKLTKTDMLNGIGYVPAGVVEIVQKQQQGWAYLRP